MKNIYVFFLGFFFSLPAFSQQVKFISYSGQISHIGRSLKDSVEMRISLLKDSGDGPVIYQEQQRIRPDSAGSFKLSIGAGKRISGNFDSIIWSDGAFYIKTESGPQQSANFNQPHVALMRISPDLGRDYEQGTVSSTDQTGYGDWSFTNTRHKRPRLVTIDLSTSYANLAYPADVYPVFRHYEWCDIDRNGLGNSFGISYSDQTENFFRENTNLLGEVKLYRQPFQEIEIESGTDQVRIKLGKPKSQADHGQTYALRGTWKFIYYIEW